MSTLLYLPKGVENLCLHKSLHPSVYNEAAVFVAATVWKDIFQQMNEFINCDVSRQQNITAKKKYATKSWKDVGEI